MKRVGLYGSHAAPSMFENEDLYLKGAEHEDGSFAALAAFCQKQPHLMDLIEIDNDKKEIRVYVPSLYLQLFPKFINKLKDSFKCISLQSFNRTDSHDRLIVYITDPVGPKEVKIGQIYEKSKIACLPDLLKKNLCFGEFHEEHYSKKIIQQNMAFFAKNGYKFLFLEHIFYDTFIQDQIDEYFDSDTLELPTLFSDWLGKIHPKGQTQDFSFSNLIKTAKENGIRVVGIDNEYCYLKYRYDGEARSEHLHGFVERIITSIAGGQKWICLMGNYHISNIYGMPGISQILPNCAAIDVHETTQPTSLSFGSLEDRDADEDHSLQREVCIACQKDSGESLDLDRLFSAGTRH
jgi:hypothetical protein